MKKKLSGRPKSIEHREAISKGRTGMKFTPKHCENIKKAQIKLAEEKKAKRLSEGKK